MKRSTGPRELESIIKFAVKSRKRKSALQRSVATREHANVHTSMEGRDFDHGSKLVLNKLLITESGFLAAIIEVSLRKATCPKTLLFNGLCTTSRTVLKLDTMLLGHFLVAKMGRKMGLEALTSCNNDDFAVYDPVVDKDLG